ncbi:Retrovirus-related Pol polyprotein from transposon TNT 1-94 [Podarcis lilfordi]|uniref:Retrovirus-related Pol polyprotein from transposon TNT 1-94 n=1 Tax=Podarcis lilfordi TaxID=74358 RepID=A0AA35P8K0_9SAUR|nr:Retrovirus-related Pol polyprotein from transposon TNT 1-94 [Podarcis lilfordi]
MSQKKKIEKLLKTYGMERANEVDTPITTQYKNEPEGQKCENATAFHSLLGSLLCLSSWTRPDITLAVHMLSQRSADPAQRDWVALKRILRYLKGTKDYKLVLDTGYDQQVYAYADASWGDRENGKSTTGYAIYIGNALVQWKSQKQTFVATSTCEAEYSAISECVSQIEWFACLTKELGIPSEMPITVLSDNMAAQQLANQQNFKSKSKHIAIRYGNVKEMC